MDQETREAFADLRTTFTKRFDALDARVTDIERQVAHQRTELVNTTKLFGAIGETISDLVHESAETRRAVHDLNERVGRLITENIRMRTADLERYAALDARLMRVEHELAELRASLK